MRKFAFLLVTVVLMFSLAACGNSEESSSKSNDTNSGGSKKLADELKVFNWAEYLPKEVIQGFEDEYGVKVLYDTYNSNQEMLTKLKSGAVIYDIVVPTDYIVQRMIKNDLLAELNMDNIPNFKNIEDSLKDQSFDPGNKHSVPYMYGTIGIAYNKKKVDKPTSWKDFWNPEYKGHVIISQSVKEDFTIPLQLLGYDPSHPTKEQLEEAKEKLIELKPNILAYDSTATAQLVNGEAWLVESYNGNAAKAHAKNPNIGFVQPEEGGIIWMDNLTIPKASKNKYTAEVFINYLLRPEVSKKISDIEKTSNPNAAAKKLMDEKLRNNPISYPPEESLKNAVYYESMKPEMLQLENRLIQEVKVK